MRTGNSPTQTSALAEVYGCAEGVVSRETFSVQPPVDNAQKEGRQDVCSASCRSHARRKEEEASIASLPILNIIARSGTHVPLSALRTSICSLGAAAMKGGSETVWKEFEVLSW